MATSGRLAASAFLALALALGHAPAADAHGERAQEAFLRMKTVAFFDVKFSKDTVKQGEPLTITGTAKILETWPPTLAEPRTGFIGVTAPGPVMVMKERTVNGEPAPGSIFVKKGGVYEFSMTLEGRRPGRWHVHPILAIEKAGALLGPGQWVTVKEAGGFTNMLTLLNGKTIDLEHYGLSFVFVWSLLGFALGVWWMLYWTVTKRTVTRLAVTNQLALNDDGASAGLITPQDHRFVNRLAALTVVLLAAGWAYSAWAYPVTIPLQVVRFEPRQIPEPPRFVNATASGARYDPDTDTLTLTVNVANLGDRPVKLTQFTASTVTFDNRSSGAARTSHQMVQEPDRQVAPGQTATLTLTMRDPVWEQERLVHLREPQLAVAGVLTFEDSEARRNRITIESSLVPTKFN